VLALPFNTKDADELYSDRTSNQDDEGESKGRGTPVTCQAQYGHHHWPEYEPHNCGNHPIEPANRETSYKNHSDTEQQE